jgi:transposase
MPKFIPYDHNQNAMIVINFRDQLQLGTFEHAIHYLIQDKLDLSVFNPAYKNQQQGRPAYDPRVLLSIVLFAYSKGITSSREIQWCCETNIIFKALSCDTAPHFTTIASFISSHPQSIEKIFEQILLICHEQGLLGNELFAIDGCKMPSNAAKEWSGTFQELTDKRDKLKKLVQHHLAEHRRIDQNDSAAEEKARRTQQTIDTLNQAHDKIDQFLKTEKPRLGHGKKPKEVKSNITDNESGKMTTSKGTIQGYNGVAAVDQKHQIVVDAQAFGGGSEQHTLQPIIEKMKARYQRLGIQEDLYASDAIVTADTGKSREANMQYLYENKINAYIPDNQFRRRDPKFAEQKEKHGTQTASDNSDNKVIFTASEFIFDPIAMTCHCPVGEAISFRGQHEDSNGNEKAFFEGRLLQCRHCKRKNECMSNPASADHRKGNGRQVSFILQENRKPNYTDWMKLRIDSEEGKRIYGHRMSVVEPVFGNIGANKRLRRFSLRGKDKVQSQWQLYCLVHNIEKLANVGQLAA